MTKGAVRERPRRRSELRQSPDRSAIFARRWSSDSSRACCRCPKGLTLANRCACAIGRRIFSAPYTTTRRELAEPSSAWRERTAKRRCLLRSSSCIWRAKESRAETPSSSAAHRPEIRRQSCLTSPPRWFAESPALNKLFRIGDTRKEISYAPLGTVYRALSADATTAHGRSVPFAVHDELARVRGPRSALYDVIESGMGAHDEPLSIIISTQAPSDGDLLSILIDEAAKGTDPRNCDGALHRSAGDGDLQRGGIARRESSVRRFSECERGARRGRARGGVARRATRLREFYDSIVALQAKLGFVSETLWAKCGAAPRPLEGQVFGGRSDLSKAAGDMTALALISNMDSVWNVHPTFWLPGDNLVEKARADRAAYDQWAKDGHLIAVPGRAQDYDVIARALASICSITARRRSLTTPGTGPSCDRHSFVTACQNM